MLRALIGLLLLPFVLVALAALLIYVPPVQNALRGKAVSYLEEKTGTTVRLDHFDLRFPIGLTLEGLFVADERGDTLLHVGTLKTQIGLRALFDKRIVLKSVDLSDVRATVVQFQDSTFNFDFIITAFAGEGSAASPTPSDTSAGSGFTIEAVGLSNVVFDLDLRPSGLSMDVRLGELAVDLDLFQLKPMSFHVNEFALENTQVDLRTRGGEPMPSTYPELVNPLEHLDVRFNTIALEDVSFTMKTVDTGDSLWLAVGEADLVARDIDLTRQRFALEQVDLEGVGFGTISAKRVVTTDMVRADPPWLDQQDGFRYWAKDWDIKVDRVHIANSSFALHTDRLGPPALLIDPDHLAFADIAIEAESLVLNNDNIAIELRRMAMHGGPKNTPLEFVVDLDATPAAVTLRNGSLKAMGNAIAFQGEATPGELSAAYRAPYNVPLAVEVGTALRLDALIPLLHQVGVELPTMITTDERWETQASFRGTARRADRIAVDLAGDQGSRLHMEGSASQLDPWPRTTFEVQLDELNMGGGFRQLVQAFMPPDIPLPQRLSARGNASGEGGTLRSAINVDSDLGRISGSVEVDNWNSRLPDGLHVALDLSEVDAGLFMGDTAMDPVSMKIIASGERLNSVARTGSLSVTPGVLNYGGNDLSSLELLAEVHGDSVQLDLTSKADAADFLLNAKGLWPEAGDSLAVDIDLALRKLSFKDLGITHHVLNTDGRFTGRVAFSTEGFGKVGLIAQGLRLFNTSQEFRFERFAFNGLLAIDSTAVDLDSDALTLAYHANMRADSLLPYAQHRLMQFFQEDSTFIPAPGEHTAFVVTLPRTEWLTDLVLPDLEAIELRTLQGHYDSDLDVFQLEIDVPHMDYAGIDVHDLLLDVDATGDTLTGTLQVARVQRDSLFVEKLGLDARNAAGGLDLTLRVRDGERDRYNIGATLRRADGTRVLRLNESLILNHDTWAAHPDNALHLGEGGLRAEHFELSSGAQRLALRSDDQSDQLAFTAFQLATITGLVNSIDSIPLVSGSVDGLISLPVADGGRLDAELTITDLHAMGVVLGTLTLDAQEIGDRHYRAEAELEHQVNHLTANVDADLSGTIPRVRAETDLAFGDLSFLKPFVADYLYAVEGGLDGDLRYQKDGTRVAITGRTTFKEARVGLIQTGAMYTLPNETLILTEQGITLDNVSVLDSAGNRFRLDGKVRTAVDKTPELDLRLSTDRFHLVNSTIEQNRTFFGDLFGSIDLTIEGTTIKPVVRGEVGVLDGTQLSVVLPGSRVELVEHDGIVVFTSEAEAPDTLELRTDGEMLRDSLAAQLPGVELDLRVHLDKRAQFAVVIDPTTGDQATFSGEADLVFRYSPDGDLYLSGPFTVAEGGYTLAFYGLVKKRFELVPGGTVIWSGDPLAGIMDIQARYRSESAPYPLVANTQTGMSESERNRLQARLPFDVLINFREVVSTPVISFGLDLDQLSRNSFPSVDNRLDQLSQAANEEELNRQVFGLLVLNTFIEDATGNETPGSNLATTAARNSVNSILTQQLNGLTGRMIKGMDVQLGVNTYDQSEGGETYQRTTVDYKVTQRILNDRVSIEAGGSIGADEREQSVGTVSNNQAAQYAITYDLTSDGRLRLRLFHENAYDLYDGEIVNNGVAINLTRDFEENARDRERRRTEIRKQREAIRPKVDGPDK